MGTADAPSEHWRNNCELRDSDIFRFREAIWSEALPLHPNSSTTSVLPNSQRLGEALFGDDGIGGLPEELLRDHFQCIQKWYHT